MMTRFLYSILVLLLCSCTFYTEPGSSSASFEPPVVPRQWQVKHYQADKSGQLCSITAGHNAIEIVMKRTTDGQIRQAVHSTRALAPGTLFHVRVGGHNYQTSSAYFPTDISRALITDLKTGNTAYFEWNERASSLRGQSSIFHNMASLAGFNAKYNECSQTLGR